MTPCPRCGAESAYELLCEPCESISHAEAFRPLADYVRARPCPDCSAPPGTDCQHPRRAALAVSHLLRDGTDAPPPELREPGRCYSTLPPVTEPAPDPPAAQRLAQLMGPLPPAEPSPIDPPFWAELI